MFAPTCSPALPTFSFRFTWSSPRNPVLLAALPHTDPVPLVLHGILLHPCLEAVLESAVATLVAFVLVHRAVAAEPARVVGLLPHAPPEKSLAAVTRGSTVVLSCSVVSTYCALGPRAKVGIVAAGLGTRVA